MAIRFSCPLDTPLTGRTPHPTRPPPGHLLLKEMALDGVLGTASTVGAAIGRPLLPQERYRAGQGSYESYSTCVRNSWRPCRPWLSLWESWHGVSRDGEGPLRPVCALGTSPRGGDKFPLSAVYAPCLHWCFSSHIAVPHPSRLTAIHLPPGGRVCGVPPLAMAGLLRWWLSHTFGCRPVRYMARC